MSGEFQLFEGEVVLRDASGKPVVVKADGNYYQLATSDQTTHDLLSSILLELKKMNVHFTIINGEAIEDADID